MFPSDKQCPCYHVATNSKDLFLCVTCTYRLHHEEQLGIAENNDTEWDSEAEEEEEHHIGLIVVFVVCGVPVWSTGALETFWNVSGEENGSQSSPSNSGTVLHKCCITCTNQNDLCVCLGTCVCEVFVHRERERDREIGVKMTLTYSSQTEGEDWQPTQTPK